MFVLSILHQIQLWFQRRAARDQLYRLTDHELRDIGLSRAMIEAAVLGREQR